MEGKVTNKKIAVISGGGDLPTRIIEKCREQKKPFLVVTFKDQEKPTNFDTISPDQTREFGLGSVGGIIKYLKKESVDEIVLAGNIKKPSLLNLNLDMTGVKLLAKVAVHHDDQLLRTIANELEKQGFKLLGAHTICDDLLIGNEILSGKKKAESKSEDIVIGIKMANEIGKLDIGQAVIVKDKVVIGVEAIEGTDGLIERCAALRGKENKGGILVKISKPQQHLDLDMPSIGINTIKRLVDLNYDGVVVSANSTIFLDKEQAVELANKNGLLLAGVDVNDCEN